MILMTSKCLSKLKLFRHKEIVEEKSDVKSETVTLQWPNLKNLSGGSDLSSGLNMVGST